MKPIGEFVGALDGRNAGAAPPDSGSSTTAYNRAAGCAAYGCPMSASMSESTRGGEGAWYCRFHFGAGHGNFDAITTVLRRCHWMLEQAEALYRMSTPNAAAFIAEIANGEWGDMIPDPDALYGPYKVTKAPQYALVDALRGQVARQVLDTLGGGKKRASAVGGVGGAESDAAAPQDAVDFLMGVE